ncbi:hypothetical protein HPP92_013125 [Vanilla planifolia]|uniref:Uncharacterized protein n=1 Tax=Vanilla planifolia TaxID=51239 RepID=A0A835V0B8_VANPL|nr:hypothetical protein HPP92_013125 [Vanilla planifolia]
MRPANEKASYASELSSGGSVRRACHAAGTHRQENHRRAPLRDGEMPPRRHLTTSSYVCVFRAMLRAGERNLPRAAKTGMEMPAAS